MAAPPVPKIALHRVNTARAAGLQSPAVAQGIAHRPVPTRRGLDHQLNDTFAQMRTDGTLEQILGKYLEHASQYLEVDTLGA